MIARLSGAVELCSPGEVVVHVGGVGYRVAVPLSTYDQLPHGEEDCRLRVVTVVREDEISLYGFASRDEEELFRLLQGVSGVGPRLALKILSGLQASALRQALASGDLRALTAVSGVGKKLAERLVVELRDKAASSMQSLPGAAQPGRGLEQDALEALEALGYPRRAAQQALRRVESDPAASVEVLIRDALKTLAPRR